MAALCDGNGGAEQRNFIKNTQIGWKDVKMNSQSLEYLESLGANLTREARQVLDTLLDKWNWENEENHNHEEAVQREVARKLWRTWKNKKSLWTLKIIHPSTAGNAPALPDLREGRKVEEPSDLTDFVTMLLATFQAAAAKYLDALTAFKPDARESLHMLGTRFNLIALPLEGANLTTSRMLALSLMKHLPNIVRKRTINKMQRQDEERGEMGGIFTNRDELMGLARAEESRVLKFKAEMRAAGETSMPR